MVFITLSALAVTLNEKSIGVGPAIGIELAPEIAPLDESDPVIPETVTPVELRSPCSDVASAGKSY